jgi:hypothetical protein
MKIEYMVTGFSNTSEKLVFERDIDETQEFLRNLMGLKKNDPLVYCYPLQTDAQKAFFTEKYGIEFSSENDYFLEAYQA